MNLKLLLFFALLSSQADAEVMLYPLKEKHLDGCGFQAKQRGRVLAENGDPNEIWLNLGHEDLRFRLIKTSGKQEKIGDQLIRHYRSGNIPLVIKTTTSGFCGATVFNSEDCEFYNLKVLIFIRQNTKPFKINGTEGC